MSKQSLREEAERLVREAMEKKAVTVTQGDTRIDTHCGKCGALNKVKAPKGQSRTEYTCKECGHKQRAL
jgi:transposase-like protein